MIGSWEIKVMAMRRMKELKAAVEWWLLGVVIGGLSGNATGAFAGVYPLLLAASLGGALAALAAAAVLYREKSRGEGRAARDQDDLIGQMADKLIGLEADVQSLRDHKKASTRTYLPGLHRIQ